MRLAPNTGIIFIDADFTLVLRQYLTRRFPVSLLSLSSSMDGEADSIYDVLLILIEMDNSQTHKGASQGIGLSTDYAQCIWPSKHAWKLKLDSVLDSEM